MFDEKRFIDGYDLKYNIINHLLRLNKFVFNISSHLPLNDQISLSSNEDCQLSFKDVQDNKVISYVDYFSDCKRGQCHIYSYPYQGKRYQSITNNFSYGLFESVREVSLFDERPFEHEFFVKIAKSFPFMEKLTLILNETISLTVSSSDETQASFTYGGKYTVTLIHGDGVGLELMQHVKTSIRCVRAPVDFEDIPLSSNVANYEMFERGVMAVKRNGIALKGWFFENSIIEIYSTQLGNIASQNTTYFFYSKFDDLFCLQ
ncbi:unnamed protein product, partial [Rotaria magnacalcarata]